MSGQVAVEIRELSYAGREPVKRLHRRCFSEGIALDELVLDNLFQHAHAINLVAVRDERIVGFAGAIHGARDKARLLTIHTDPDVRRAGVASALLDVLEERLRARQASAIELEVHVENQAAQRLYEDRGFEVVREDPTAYPSVEPSSGYVMRKEL